MAEIRSTRREFVQQSAALAAGLWISSHTVRAESRSANGKLKIAAIGAGGKGRTDTRECSSEDIVALCDPDGKRAEETFAKYPDAKRFTDYRVMLDQLTDLDAVLVSCPDHNHAPASVLAMQKGLHVYCQKPLTHSIHEARRLREVAKERKVVTQMGNQGHSYDGTRRVVELVRAGAIGEIREVHVWTDRPGKYWKQPLDRPQERPAIPAHLDWNVWLGPASERPYHPTYAPHDWRAWFDFGTGALGDMGCHVMDTAFWALDLGFPNSVTPEIFDPRPETYPGAEIITYQFPARGKLPPVKLTWYDSGKLPPRELADGNPLPGTGSLLIGSEGKLYMPDPYSSTYKLLPEDKFKDYKGPEASIPRTGNNPYTEWIAACKGGPMCLSNFDYASLLTETVLLGTLAVRLGKPIEWDADQMRVKGLPEADQHISPKYRDGWTL